MASLRSIRAGLSRSYHSLNTISNNDNHTSDDHTTDWLGVDNFRINNNNNITSPIAFIKSAVAKVSSRGKGSSSKVSNILKELDEEWNINDEENKAGFLG